MNKKCQVNVCEYAGNGWFKHFLPCYYPVARNMFEKRISVDCYLYIFRALLKIRDSHWLFRRFLSADSQRLQGINEESGLGRTLNIKGKLS